MKYLAWIALALPTLGTAAQNTGSVSIASVESRNSTHHQVTIGSLYAGATFPDEKCDLTDRGVIDDQVVAHSDMLFRMALNALVTGKQVSLTVDGCSPIRAPEGPFDMVPDAPRIVGVRFE